nr:twin-arginine translocase TatA/TatE family subunit [Iodidimonas nitroreducens]
MKITPILSDGGQQESENEYRFLANRLIAVVVILLFGRGKISDLMGDVAKGITSFKKGLREDEAAVEKSTADDSDQAKERKAIADKRAVKSQAGVNNADAASQNVGETADGASKSA